VHDHIPAKAAPKCAATAGIKADVINTEKTSTVVVHIDEVIGERGLLIEVHKRPVSGAMDLAIFFVTDTVNFV
jgi:hypothetical protein